MALEEHIYDYLVNSYQIRRDYRLSRRQKINNMLIVVGLLATMALAVSADVYSLLPQHIALFAIQAVFLLSALVCALVAAYKLFTYNGYVSHAAFPGVDKGGFQKLLAWRGKADEAKLLSELSKNYLDAIQVYDSTRRELSLYSRSAHRWVRYAFIATATYAVATLAVGVARAFLGG